ncbi:MAG TPA: hypothetical protein VF121_11770, partial [Thermoanaerobaculia bacterium]|nr:hypothetical protein [Thermoanaerobaculia bacterium]
MLGGLLWVKIRPLTMQRAAVLLLALSAVAPPLAAAPAPEAKKPAVIEIRPRRPDPIAAARERERIARAMPGWCAGYRAAVGPLRAAVDETDESLAMS